MLTPEQMALLPPEAQATLRAGMLFQQALGNKETAAAAFAIAEATQKKANPAYRTSAEIAQPLLEQALAKVDERLKARDIETAKRNAERDLQTQIETAKTAHGYTDEGIARILKSMTEKGVGDFETAMKSDLHDHPNAPAMPPGSADQMDWNVYPTMEQGDNKTFFDGSQVGAPSIHQDPSAWARATALKYLDGKIALPA